MSKGQSKKKLNERTGLIKNKLESRYKKLAKAIYAAKCGKLNLGELNALKCELETPVKLSEHLSIQIEDCHPSTGTYQRALPKGYQSDIITVNKAVIQSSIEEEIRLKNRDIVEAFNLKPKKGIQLIKDICITNKLDSVVQQISDFLYKNKQNLDLEAVGDYLSGPDPENQAVLQAFTGQIDLRNQSITKGLRTFLHTFKLPGEAQKIDRLVECFSEAYCQQNPGSTIANKDAVYILAFQIIMLNTDLHNPSVASKYKMDFNGLKNNLRGLNKGEDFKVPFLQELYDDIKANPFEMNFIKTNPGYEIASSALTDDVTFNLLDSLLQSSNIKIRDIFPDIGNNIVATVDVPKSWLNFLTGYEGTVTLKDQTTGTKLVTIQVYNPNILSKWLFGDHPKLIIQPVYQDGTVAQETLRLAAKITARFTPRVTGIKATYDYLKTDLTTAYDQEKPSLQKANPFRLWAPKTKENNKTVQSEAEQSSTQVLS